MSDNKMSTVGAPFANPEGTPTKNKNTNDMLLAKLKQDFIKNKCNETWIPLAKCLTKSTIIVPMMLGLSDDDLAKMNEALDGETVELTEEVKLHPDIFQGGDKRFFPIFTSEQFIPEDYAQEHSLVSMPTIAALKMAHLIEGLDGIVLDPFTHSVGMPFKMADTIYQYSL